MTNSYLYLALKFLENRFVRVHSADHIKLWADEVFVNDFERQLAKYFNKIKGNVEIDGAFFTDCLIHQPNTGIEDYHYIKVDDSFIPFDKNAIDIININLPAIKEMYLDAKDSEQYYHNYYISLDNNYLFPYCEFSSYGVRQFLDENMLLSSPYSLIIGPAGCGKTSLVRKLTYELSSTIFKKKRKHHITPFYFMLRDCFDNNDDISAIIKSRAKTINNEYYVSQRTSGRLLFIFDGLDELNLEYRKKFASWFTDLKVNYPSVRIIITSREIDFLENNIFDDFTTVKILPLYQDQIKEYCHRYLGSEDKANKYYDLVKSNSQLLKLLSNPLTLALSLSLYVVKQLLPYNVGTLMKEIVYFFTENWDEKRQIRRYENLTPNMSRWLLGKIAYNLQLKDSYTFTPNFIEKLVPHELSKTSPDNVLKELKDATGILVCRDNGWAFAHRYFIDFFCAYYLIEKSGSIENDFTTHGTHNKWFNVWNQTAELSSDPEFYITRTAVRNDVPFYTIDRLFTILLASDKLNYSGFKKLIQVISSNLCKLDEDIEKHYLSKKNCNITLKADSAIEPEAFALFIVKIYHLSTTENVTVLKNLLETNQCKLSMILEQIISQKASPEYVIDMKTIHFRFYQIANNRHDRP